MNAYWSVDFQHEQLSEGRPCRFFNVINDFNQEGLAIDADIRLPADRVIQLLDRMAWQT